jgi:hypothetical protein
MEATDRDQPQTVSVGSAMLTVPEAWSLSSRSENEVVLRSAGSREQATISTIGFERLLSFEEFCSVCAHRVEAEKKGLRDGFIHPDPPVPFQADGGHRMVYIGGDKSTHRVFSAYLLQIESEVLTVYLEGLGIPLTEHSKTFNQLLSTLRRKKRQQ